jgi:histidinol-phosphate aminotransferase
MQMVEARQTLCEIACTNGLKPLPSATNFVTIDCGQDAAFARAVLTHLLENDVFARMPSAPPLDRCIRVSCSTPEDLQIFGRVLPRALESARKRQLTGVP